MGPDTAHVTISEQSRTQTTPMTDKLRLLERETNAQREYRAATGGNYYDAEQEYRIEQLTNPLTRKYVQVFRKYVRDKFAIQEDHPVAKIEDLQHHHSQNAALATRYISLFLQATKDFFAFSDMIRARRVSGEQLWNNKLLLVYCVAFYGMEVVLRLRPKKTFEYAKEKIAKTFAPQVSQEAQAKLGPKWSPNQVRSGEISEITKGYIASNTHGKFDFSMSCSQEISLDDPDQVAILLHNTANAMRDLHPQVKQNKIQWGYLTYPKLKKQTIEKISPEMSFPITFGRTGETGVREYATVYHFPQHGLEDFSARIHEIYSDQKKWGSKCTISRSLFGVELDPKSLYDQYQTADLMSTGEHGKPMFVFLQGQIPGSDQSEVQVNVKHLPFDGYLISLVLQTAQNKHRENGGSDILKKDKPLPDNSLHIEGYDKSIIIRYNKDLNVPPNLRLDSYLWFLQEWIRHHKTLAKTDSRYTKYLSMPDTISANAPVAQRDPVAAIGVAALGRHDPEAINPRSAVYRIRNALSSASVLNQLAVEKDAVRDGKVGDPLPKCMSLMKHVAESTLPEPVIYALMTLLDSNLLAPARASLGSAVTLTQETIKVHEYIGEHTTPGSFDYICECGIEGPYTRTNIYTWNPKSTLFLAREMFEEFVVAASEMRRAYELLLMNWSQDESGLEELDSSIVQLNTLARNRLQSLRT